MKAFFKWFGEWWFLILLIGGITLIAACLIISGIIADAERLDICYRGGYDTVEYLGALNRPGCLDIREGGVYVVVPLDIVRAELEAQ